MYVVKVLVDNWNQAQVISKVLERGEAEGDIDFSFGYKLGESMTLAEAQAEFADKGVQRSGTG
jgi:hypothetical protein